jgi:hypothetical protein
MIARKHAGVAEDVNFLQEFLITHLFAQFAVRKFEQQGGRGHGYGSGRMRISTLDTFKKCAGMAM